MKNRDTSVSHLRRSVVRKGRSSSGRRSSPNGAGSGKLDRVDPSRTGPLFRALRAEMARGMRRLRGALITMIDTGDALGLREGSYTAAIWGPTGNTAVTANAGEWRFETNDRKVERFRAWLRERMGSDLAGDRVISKYIELGYKKGILRSYDDTKRAAQRDARQKQLLEMFSESREGFVKASLGQRRSIEAVKLLAGRTFSEMEDLHSQTAAKMSRALADGLVRGKTPSEIAGDLVKELDLDRSRAETIARTEIVRAHAEGQLTALEQLGVEEVGVAVEWDTADDGRVCPKCEPLEGVVLTIDEARGLLPRHPNCRCAWIPANVGESDSDIAAQVRSVKGIRKAMADSATAGANPEPTPGNIAAYEVGRDGWTPPAIGSTRPTGNISPALLEFSRWLVTQAEGDNCGTGAGGFEPGNTCAKGAESRIEKEAADAREVTDEFVKQRAPHPGSRPLGWYKENPEVVREDVAHELRIGTFDVTRAEQAHVGRRSWDIEKDATVVSALAEHSVIDSLKVFRGVAFSDPAKAREYVEKTFGNGWYKTKNTGWPESFTRDPDVAEDFATKTGAQMYRSGREKNASGVFIEVEGSKYGPMRGSDLHYGEAESVLPRGQAYRVERITHEVDDKGHHTYRVRLRHDESVTGNIEGDNCGTGAGGFQPGNTCGKGEGKSEKSTKKRRGKVSEPAKYTFRNREEAISQIHADISAQDHIAPYTASHMKEAVSKVLGAMPEGAIKQLGENLEGIRWSSSARSLTDHVTSFAGHLAGGALLNGLYDSGTGLAYLTGPTREESEYRGILRGVEKTVTGTYAHELTHAFDRNDKLTGNREWEGISRRELMTGGLSEYARTSSAEAFAEFGRLLYGSGIPKSTARQTFPESYAYFRKHGLVED